MPLINGMKMACEPCIRGHRSTKCTHADERLMVPVKKPGRPLSACPHPKEQQCGCGSVTAAIPRKQRCHCGTSTPSSEHATQLESNGGGADVQSPSKPTFKIQKTTSRPPSSRKQSFDPINLERMDMNSINIVPFEQTSQAVPLTFTNGYAFPGDPQPYGCIPVYPNIQAHFSQFPIQAPPRVHTSIPGRINDFSKENGNGLEHIFESPSATPTTLNNGSKEATNGGSCCAPPLPSNETNVKSNGGSCCAPQPSSHSSSRASSISEPPDKKPGNCCSSSSAPPVKQESILGLSTPALTPCMPQQILLPNGVPFDPSFYPQYVPQTTVFTYPSTYGSFQNPLQPSAWLQSVRANSYGQPQMQPSLPLGGLPFDPPVIPENLDTVHTCSCGDSCQCIGCAAHPYNDATQDYVRSAWSSMNVEQTPGEINANVHSNGNGHNVPGETISSPTAHTPSSTASGNGDEQSLSASDFFFVNYAFSSDGCGGDTQSCPCGDDCQCLGCTIHRQPPIPCEGERDMCPCGDDCECIGCEIHNGVLKV